MHYLVKSIYIFHQLNFIVKYSGPICVSSQCIALIKWHVNYHENIHFYSAIFLLRLSIIFYKTSVLTSMCTYIAIVI